MSAGDVPRIRRFDEMNGEDRNQTYFTDHPGIEAYMEYMNVIVPDDSAFDVALGDDSHLVRGGNEVIAIGRGLDTVIDRSDEAARHELNTYRKYKVTKRPDTEAA
jgi:hypothetical protein